MGAFSGYTRHGHQVLFLLSPSRAMFSHHEEHEGSQRGAKALFFPLCFLVSLVVKHFYVWFRLIWVRQKVKDYARDQYSLNSHNFGSIVPQNVEMIPEKHLVESALSLIK